MGLFKPGANKKAKEISKTNKGKTYEVPAIRGQRGAMSVTPKLAVATVKTKGTPAKVVVQKELPKYNLAGRAMTSDMPRINTSPKAGQEKKVVKTYVGGQLSMKEKQGKNMLGQPVVKTKTYSADGLKKGKEKATLTKVGIQRRTKY